MTITSVVLYLLFPEMLGPEGWKAAGMLVGVYTGGTPNLAAVGKALDVNAVTLVSVQGADVIVGAVLLLFPVSLAPRLFGKVLPAFEDITGEESDVNGFSPYFTGWSGRELREMGAALGLAAVIVAVGASFMLFLPEASALPAAVSIVHLVLSAIFRVDAHTHIVTATSFIYSPPFVPVVAAAIGNPKVVLPGIVIGVTGWIGGNYLGPAIAYALRSLG